MSEMLKEEASSSQISENRQNKIPQRFIAEELRCALLWNRQSPKQEEASRSPKRKRIIWGGNRTGKTYFGAQEIASALFGNHKFRDDFKAPLEVWCACPSYDTQFDTTQKKLAEMIPKHRIKKITNIRNDIWSRVEIDNGSSIIFKSYDQGREKFQGAGKRIIWFDEEPPFDVWQEANMRMEAGQRLDILLTMTPVNGMSWVYDQLYLNVDDPDIFQIVLGWNDNPWLTAEQKEQMERGLSPEMLAIRRDGSFVQHTGQVCNWWRREVHLMKDLYRQPDWNIYRIIDFGWSSSKTCVLWIGIDSYERVYIFDGLYVNETTDEELAKIIKDKESDFRVTKGWADNTPDRIQGLARHGIVCEAVKKTVGGERNWDTVKTESMARVGKIDPVSGKSRLCVSTGLTYVKAGNSVNWFVEEIETLRWKEKRIGAGMHAETSEWSKEIGPKDSHFDAMDCFAYFCVMYERSNRRFREKHVGELEGRDYREYEEKAGRPVRKTQRHTPINPLTGY